MVYILGGVPFLEWLPIPSPRTISSEMIHNIHMQYVMNTQIKHRYFPALSYLFFLLYTKLLSKLNKIIRARQNKLFFPHFIIGWGFFDCDLC